MKVKRFLVWGLCCAGMLAGCQQKAGMQSSGDTYPLLTVKPEDRQLSVKYSAVIEGKQDVEVRPQVFEINDGTEYIVESGLQSGDVIVSEGAGLLKEGTVVDPAVAAQEVKEED